MSRFSEPQDPDFQAINASLAFDRRLWRHDVAQSRAHAAMLASIGVIDEAERDELLHGLDAVGGELAAGSFAFLPDDEDIHMAIERRLTELAGAVGGKLHTARSRNDQVATDMALFVREASASAHAALGALLEVLLARAEEHVDWPMPGHTHLHRAQLAKELGFESVAANSIDAVSNRDFALDYLAAAATAATHLSRLGAELVLWSSEEFGFCALSDAWSSGSSIMPQKKNPDAAELLRAKAPRIVA